MYCSHWHTFRRFSISKNFCSPTCPATIANISQWDRQLYSWVPRHSFLVVGKSKFSQTSKFSQANLAKSHKVGSYESRTWEHQNENNEKATSTPQYQNVQVWQILVLRYQRSRISKYIVIFSYRYSLVGYRSKLGKLACLGKLAFTHHEERVAGDPRVVPAKQRNLSYAIYFKIARIRDLM
jgi:hypothetical protein